MIRAKNAQYYRDLKLTVDTYYRLESMQKAADYLGVNMSTVSRRMKEADSLDIRYNSDMDIVLQNVGLAKQKQALQDTQRIERKSFREHARVENAVEAVMIEVLDALKSHKLPALKSNIIQPLSKSAAIIHISDNHLNEMVDLPHNQFNWNVAAQRLQKFALRAIQLCNVYNIQSVLVAFTGDLLNSDRRLDEALTNAPNRASASVLAVHLYGQFLEHLSKHLNVSAASISGNESRIQKDVAWTREVASDNYDALIFNMLKMTHGDIVNFSTSQRPNEQIVHIAGQNVLLIHGHGAKGTGQANIQSIKGRYIAQGVMIDAVFSGHFHEAHVSDAYARSSSLVGSNAYAEDALNLTGRASQNIYIMHEGGGFDGIKVDLQNADSYDGYAITKQLETYNTKSASKAHEQEVIFKVVI